MFTIYGLHNIHYFLFAFCLLRNKNLNTFFNLYSLLTRKCTESFNSQNIVIDGMNRTPNSFVLFSERFVDMPNLQVGLTKRLAACPICMYPKLQLDEYNDIIFK